MERSHPSWVGLVRRVSIIGAALSVVMACSIEDRVLNVGPGSCPFVFPGACGTCFDANCTTACDSCGSDSQCNAVLTCVSSCSADVVSCATSCSTLPGAKGSAFRSVANCMSGTCGTECGGGTGGASGTGGAGALGCDLNWLNNCTTDADCSDCGWTCVTGSCAVACQSDSDCVGQRIGPTDTPKCETALGGWCGSI